MRKSRKVAGAVSNRDAGNGGFISGYDDEKLADYARSNGMHESTITEIFRQRTTLGLDPKAEIERYVKTFAAGGPEPTKSFTSEPSELSNDEESIAGKIIAGHIRHQTIV